MIMLSPSAVMATRSLSFRNPRRSGAAAFFAGAVLLWASLLTQAAPPDLTAGGTVPTTAANSGTINLGATGMRGWIYHVNENFTESRQILVTAVDAGSPAAGVLAVNDVILGADGSGASPLAFSSDARRSLAQAITDAEARNPGTLGLLRWRAGTTTAVQITLRTMGAYSATAPYNCPKSAKILREGADYFLKSQTSGRYSFGTLALLAVKDPADPNNAAYLARAQTEARALVPSAATMAQLMSNARDATSMITWQRGHTLIVLAEYYLATNDAVVLPAIEAYAVNISKNQSMFGTVGHIFAEKNPDGSDNGPMGGVYGVVNSTGLPCFYGLLLARECGVTHATLAPAIERSSRFFASYAGKGSIPYGEHEPGYQSHESNGKNGLCALAFALQSNRVNEGRFFAKMATASASERELGHTGAFFNNLWAPLGAAAGGETAAAAHFSKVSWHYDLARRWNGAFVYDHTGTNGTSPSNGAEYNDFRMATVALLTYALPLRNLHVTGRNQNPSPLLLTSGEVDAAIAANTYNPSGRSNDELVTDLGNWSPKVRMLASDQLKTRTVSVALISQVTALANDPGGSSRVGACLALGKITDSGSAGARATTLAALLTDPDGHVRMIAAESLRQMGSARNAVVNTILAAAASTARPVVPFVEDDPLQFAHAKVAMLLFYSGSAYGPKGVLYNSITGVDRNLLYPAIKAVAATPTGLARSTVASTYKLLTLNDTLAVADAVVDSVQFRAPADKMFTNGVRQGGIEVLQKYGFAEGVPLSLIYMRNDVRDSVKPAAIGVLKAYAGSCTTVVPNPGVIEFLQSLGTVEALAALDVITAIPNLNPGPATPLKSIQSITADAATLTLPARSTVLRVNATDYARGPAVTSTYTWRKVQGAGAVSFTPNGTAASVATSIQIDAIPGSYLFEVTMTDSRGLTEVSATIGVNVVDSSSETTPPSPNPMSWANPPAATLSTAITMTATTANDPAGVEYFFDCTTGGGHDSGWQDSPTYTDTGLTPSTSYTYQVKARDKSSNANETGYSPARSATTTAPDTTAPTPNPLTWTSPPTAMSISAITMTANTATDPAGVEYFFDCLTAGGHDSGWQDSPTYTDSGLRPSTSYIYQVRARDKSPNFNATGFSVTRSATTPGAAVECELGVWTPLANGGINPATGNPWQPGDSYRLAFVTSTTGSKASADITTYNSFVQSAAAGSSMFPKLGNGIWKAIGSTSTVAARDNTGTNPTTNGTGVPVILMDGTTVFATNNTDLWNGSALRSTGVYMSIYLDENGVEPASSVSVYTGSNSNGTPSSSQPLGIATNAATGLTRPSNGSTWMLQYNSGSPLSFYALSEPLTLKAGSDITPPTLAGSAIVDDKGGAAVVANTLVTYTVTFSKDMNAGTVSALDFGNAGSAAVAIGTVIETDAGVFSVPVTAIGTGTLQLRVNPGAELKDLSGNALDTASAIADDTILTVNPAMVAVPDVVGQTQANAQANLDAADLVVGTVTQQASDTIPLGTVISQSPGGGASLLPGSPVDLVISLGDITAPIISTFSPADNSINVSVGTNLVLTFSESIALGTGNITFANLTNGTQSVIPITDTTQVSLSGSVLTINPTANLAGSKSYAIRIDAGAVTDAADNPFAGISNDTTWNFATAATPSNADITIIGSPVEAFLNSAKNGFATTHLGTTQISYDATGADKLVVAIGTEAGNNGQKVNSVSISFNGTPMTAAVLDNTMTPAAGQAGAYDGGYAGIFYLDNPVQGPASFTFSASMSSGSANGAHVTIIGLAGTKSGMGNTGASWATQAAAGNVSTNLTTSANKSMAIAMVSNSGRNNSAGTPVLASGSLMTLAHNGQYGSSVWLGAASARQSVPASGTTVTPTFNTAAGGNIHVVAVEFKASEISPNAYAVWSAQHPSANLTDPSTDNDKGGLPTGIEWVVGGNPTLSGDDAGLAPTLAATTDPNGKFLFTYRRSDAAKLDPNTTIAVEYGEVLTRWTPATHQGTGANQITITEVPGVPGFANVTVALPQSLAVSGKLFVRLKAALVIP